MKIIKISALFIILYSNEALAMKDVDPNGCFGYVIKQLSTWWRARKQQERTNDLLKTTFNRTADLKKVTELISAGASLKGTSQIGWTPLHNAAFQNHTQVAEHLIDKGAAIDSKSKDGLTPLHVAAIHNNLEVLKLLLKCNASIELQNNEGQTVFHCAAQRGYFNILLCLVCKSFFLPTWQDEKVRIVLNDIEENRHKEAEILLTTLRRINETTHDLSEKNIDLLEPYKEAEMLLTTLKKINEVAPKLSKKDIGFLEPWSAGLIADLVALKYQKQMIRMSNDVMFEKALMVAHGKRYLKGLQHMLALKDHAGKTAGDRASIGDYPLSTLVNPQQFLIDIQRAKKISDLSPSVQKALINNIEERFAGKIDS